MKIVSIAGFAPITEEPAASRALYLDTLRLPLQAHDDYLSVDKFAGANHFGVWPLHMAALSCFGTQTWPADVPVPHATIEFELESVRDIAEAVQEMTAKGYRFVHEAREEAWGQTVARFISPEGLLVGLSYAPWLHEEQGPAAVRQRDHAGSCLCGGITYKIAGELSDFGYCHCTKCRKASGSAHAANAGVDRADVELTDTHGYLREFESSPGTRRAFCSNCGSPLFAWQTRTPEIIRIRLGTLDTPFLARAKAHTWVSHKATWDVIEGTLPQFDEWPPRDVLVQKGSRQP